MKRILSVFLLIAMTVSTFAILPAQAAAPITSTEEDSIVPSPLGQHRNRRRGLLLRD